MQTGQVSVDGWLKMNAPAQIAVLFKELRITLDSVLKGLMNNPKVCWILLMKHHSQQKIGLYYFYKEAYPSALTDRWLHFWVGLKTSKKGIKRPSYPKCFHSHYHNISMNSR